MRSFFFTLLALTLAVVSVDARLRLGLAWGADNRWSTKVKNSNIEWYWHWQMGAVDQMPKGVEYVPNFWGKSKWSQWNQRKKEIKKFNSQRILAFNEPDVPGQSNMKPQEAANIFMSGESGPIVRVVALFPLLTRRSPH